MMTSQGWEAKVWWIFWNIPYIRNAQPKLVPFPTATAATAAAAATAATAATVPTKYPHSIYTTYYHTMSGMDLRRFCSDVAEVL